MLTVKFSGDETFHASLSGDDQFAAELGETIVKPVADYYTGEYEYTPSAEEQTVPIDGLVATSNIIVHAIPNNYGLITWNGSTITVS